MMLLALLLAVDPVCSPTTINTTWNTGGRLWQCNGSTWVSYTADAGGIPVLQGGPFSVSCANCSGGVGSVVTLDGGVTAISNFPAQWTIVDGGTVNVGNFPTTMSCTLDGGSAVISGTVTVAGYVPPDGGVNVNNFPATQYVVGVVTIDGGVIPVTGTFWQSTQPVSVASLPASQSQGADPNGAAHTMLTDPLGAQYISTPKPLPLPKCNPVRRYNCQ